MSSSTKPRPVAPAFPWVLVGLLVALYGSLSSGLVSSNDGSHVALGRAVVLRHETSIDPDVGLTLWVDYALREGSQYSDRPPGTAFAALPALWLGDRLDPGWSEATRARIEAGVDVGDVDALVVVRPATDRYLATYGARRRERGGRSPNLIALQGTALLVGWHAAAMGGLGLIGLVLLLRRRGVDTGGQCVTVLAIGLGTLWGPYATVLFSHVTAGTAVVWCWWGCEQLGDAESRRGQGMAGGLAGVAGAWAVSVDYGLALVVVPLIAVSTRPQRWGWVALGALPIAVAVAGYHRAAFGSALSIGYDHHATFAFAQSRASTFSGDPIAGFWTLWGAGRGAGVVVLSPILLVAVAGLRRDFKVALAFVPWLILLCFHRTPWGGAGEDHRYLIPVVLVLGVGLGRVWTAVMGQSRARAAGLGGGLVMVAAISSALVWSHFFAWRG